MRKYYFLLPLFLAFFCYSHAENSSSVITRTGKKLEANKMLSAGSAGNEFVIAIPSNEISYLSADYISIYVTSPFNTIVKFKDNMSGGVGINKTIKAYKITTIARSISDEIANIAEFETPINRTFTLTSDKRFCVYVMNRKPATSDGYMAIPTSGWGTNYIHLCNYDNPETIGSQGYNYGSGFVVLAKSNNTHIKIRVVDQANKNVFPYYGLGRTIGGKKGGDSILVTLHAGQAYAIQGNGAGPGSGGAIGYLDLSGTEIESDSLIGLISYHNRTDLPVNANSSRNYLVEMLPPVSSWGKLIVTVEFDRSNTGDLIRVVASENNTFLKVRWYNKITKTSIARQSTVLNKGDIWEYQNNIAQTGSLKGVRGTSIIEADKPVLANQYAYDGGWDNSDFDPFMITLTPVDMFGYGTVFQTPTGFSQNYYNFIAKGYLPEDTLDANFIDPITKKAFSPSVINNMKLTSLYFGNGDGSMHQIDSLKNSRIPTTGGASAPNGDTIGGLYWGTVFTTEGVYRMVSQGKLTTFGGYVYGFESVDAYGWPAGNVYQDITYYDSLAPIMTSKEFTDGVNWNYTFKDTVTISINDTVQQNDLGIACVKLIHGLNIDKKDFSYNIALVNTSGAVVDSINAYSSTCSFSLKIIDTSYSARAIVLVRDIAGNFTTDTVNYQYMTYIDSLAPKINLKTKTTTSTWTYHCSDSAYYKLNDSTYQEDKGLSKIFLMKKSNIALFDSLGRVVDTIKTILKTSTFSVQAVSTADSARAIICIMDRNNNTRFDTLNFMPGPIYIDSLAPVCTGRDNYSVGAWKLSYTDSSSYKINDTLYQKDLGIAKIFFLHHVNFNLVDSINAVRDIIRPMAPTYSFWAKVSDTSKTGTAILRVEDASGNFVLDTIIYQPGPNGVSEITSNTIFTVSPNPAGERINVSLKSLDYADFELSIYNSLGEKIKTLANGTINGNAKSLDFSTEGLSSGAYFIKLKIGSATETQKIIINK